MHNFDGDIFASLKAGLVQPFAFKEDFGNFGTLVTLVRISMGMQLLVVDYFCD